MTLEKQVVSLELARKLKKLGVPQESLFFWHTGPTVEPAIILGKGYEYNRRTCLGYDNYSAFTVAELGEMLPQAIGYEDSQFFLNIGKYSGGWGVRYKKPARGVILHTEQALTEADARAKMRIYLLENDLIKL